MCWGFPGNPLHRLCLLSLFLTACFSSTTEEGSGPTLHDDPPPGWDDDGGGGGGGGGGGDDGGTWGGTIDDDGDGFADDVDCDDDDEDVNPGVAEDSCDGVDSDCDGIVDEDFDGDSYEAADDSGGTQLGELTDDDARISAYLNPETDEDYFYFYVEDSNWDWFGITIDISVPTTVDIVGELWFFPDDGDDWLQMDVIDDGTTGRDEYLDYPGGYGGDDSGWYGLILYSADGASCEDSYVIDIEA